MAFYETNIKILKFSIDKDLDKIRFNHYIEQKENYQRLKKSLPKGQFYLTVRNVAKDLNITHIKAQRLVNEFIALGIIKSVFRGARGSKKASIYEYNSCSKNEIDTYKTSDFNSSKGDTDNDTDNDTDKTSNFNGLEGINDTDNDTDNDTSKKELRKKNYKKDIYIKFSRFKEDELLKRVDKVKLTKKDYNSLVDLFGVQMVRKKILELDESIENKKINSRNHFKTLTTWCNREKPVKSKEELENELEYDYDYTYPDYRD